MKIIFVSLPWTDDLGTFARIAKKRTAYPSLGILYLAAIAEKRGHGVKIIDAEAEGIAIKEIVARIIRDGCDVVGITATSPIFHKAVSLATALKEAGAPALTVIGGEHMNIFKKEAFSDCFDYGFYGESDDAFDGFLRLLENKSVSFESLKGFIYRKDGKVVENGPSPRMDNLDNLLFPAMHLLRRDAYVMTFATAGKRRYLPLMAARGCPFKCAFCSEPLTNPHVRFRSPGNIADEIEKWNDELGVSHFFFVDSNLTLNRAQITGVCEEILRRKLEITFEGWTRVNLVDRDTLGLMKKAGLIRMSYGIESGDEEILRIIKKEITRKDMLDAFRMTGDLGIEPACFLMLGLPGETRASVKKTIDFVKGIPHLLLSNFSIVNPYPGTEIYEWAKAGKYGMRLEIDDFSKYRRYEGSPVSVNDLSSRDLVRLQKVGLFKIHFTIRRMRAAVKMLGLSQILVLFIKLIKEILAGFFKGRGQGHIA